MKSNGFRFLVLLVCTTYHAVLLMLLNANLQSSDCPSNNNKGMGRSERTQHFLDLTTLNTSIDEYPVHRDEMEIVSLRKDSFQTLLPDEKESDNITYISDRGAWLVFCVIRYCISELQSVCLVVGCCLPDHLIMTSVYDSALPQCTARK